MNKNRVDALTDGIIAIIITIMVLEMKTPWQTLSSLSTVLISYVLSFQKRMSIALASAILAIDENRSVKRWTYHLPEIQTINVRK